MQMHTHTHTHTKETRTLQPQLPILPSLITHSHSNIHTHTHTHTECHTQAPFPHTCPLPNSAIPHQHITNMCTHTCMPIKQQQSRCCNSKTLTRCITCRQNHPTSKCQRQHQQQQQQHKSNVIQTIQPNIVNANMYTYTHTKETRTLQPQLPILPSLITHSHSNIHTHTHTHTECHTQAPFPHTCPLPNSAIPHQHITNMCTHTCMPIKQQQSRCCNSETLTGCITCRQNHPASKCQRQHQHQQHQQHQTAHVK